MSQHEPTGPVDADSLARRRRVWTIAGAAVILVFVVSVLLSARSSSVPVGASGTMSGMSMGSGKFMTEMRDVSGRSLKVPAGRPGLVVTAEARECAECVSAARTAREAVKKSGTNAQLIVLIVDAATSRDQVTSFAKAVGGAPARYVVDDRNGMLVSMLGVSAVSRAVVYDANGQIVDQPQPKERALVASLRRASGSASGSGGASAPASKLVDPKAFARAIAAPGTVTVNVHVPYDGEIAGTDRFIPYDRIAAGGTRLPPRSTRLAIYCRSGRMSAIAAQELARLGYKRIVELRGGMDAWRASGLTVRYRQGA